MTNSSHLKSKDSLRFGMDIKGFLNPLPHSTLMLNGSTFSNGLNCLPIAPLLVLRDCDSPQLKGLSVTLASGGKWKWTCKES